MKTVRPSVGFPILLLFVLPFTTLGQWIKNESLQGGSTVADIIEFNQSLFVSFHGTGIFRSVDQGETWVQTSVPGQPNLTSMVVSGNKLVAINYGKTFVTTNGLDWIEGSGPEGFINDADSEGDIIFAATHLGIYKSTDQGATWQRAADPQVRVSIQSISVSGTTVWASSGEAVGTLFKSTDAGATWTKVTKGAAIIKDVAITPTEVFINILSEGIYRSTNQGADWQLVRNLTNSFGRMFVSEAGIFYASPYDVYYSKNSGSTWQQKSKSYPFFNFNSLYATSEKIYLGLIGGGMLTTSHTDASTDWRFINKGIATPTIADFAFEGNKLYAGLEDSFLRISEDRGATWTQKSALFGLFGTSVRALMVKNGVIYTGSGGGGVLKSTDGGTTWIEKSQGLESKSILSIVSTANAMFVASPEGVYKSTNGGDTWTNKTGNTMSMRKLYWNGTSLYAATFAGLFESKDEGETWTIINSALPGTSVNDVISMGSTLLVATQSSGVYKTTNSGATWTKMNDHFVLRFSTHNQYLFMGVLSGPLLISADTAKTSEDIAASLPVGNVTYGGVIGDDIVVAKANLGYWTRKASALLKPYIALTSSRPQNKLLPTEAIMLKTDQKLFTAGGTAVSATNIGTYITLKDKAGNPIGFSVQPGTDEKSFNLTITNAKIDETYTVSVSSLLNDSGLSSAQAVANFTILNPVPVLTDISLSMEADRTPLAFSNEIFEAAYQDDQTLASFIVKTLPANGQLKINETSVTTGQVIAVNAIDNLTYTARETFSGTDSWTWNASDGTSYAAVDAKVTIAVPAVTGIAEEFALEIQTYPNPTTSVLNVELTPVDGMSLRFYDIMGRELSDTRLHSEKRADRMVYSIDTEHYHPGLYFVRVDVGSRHVLARFVKRQ